MTSNFQLLPLVVFIIYLFYAFVIIKMINIWAKENVFYPNPKSRFGFQGIQISVIIPVRNEEKGILKLLEDLQNQTLNHSLFEVIVVNDASTDTTEAIVQNFVSNYKLSLINLVEEKSSAPKKRAISEAIQVAKGNLIVSTDGDCRVGADWLKTILFFQQQTKAVFVSGLVKIEPNSSFFSKLQSIEFASLVGTGAISIFNKTPTMCNGANIAYLKSAFIEVNGFEGNENLASGDDEFLMHKMFVQYPERIRFLKSDLATVSTNPCHSLGVFVNQRKRWASKWRFYKDYKVSLVAISIFLLNLMSIFVFFSFNKPLVLTGFCLKFCADFYIYILILRFLGFKNLLFYIPFVLLLYPFYVVFIGILSLKSGYSWKNRQLK